MAFKVTGPASCPTRGGGTGEEELEVRAGKQCVQGPTVTGDGFISCSLSTHRMRALRARPSLAERRTPEETFRRVTVTGTSQATAGVQRKGHLSPGCLTPNPVLFPSQPSCCPLVRGTPGPCSWSLPGQKLITAPSEQPGLRERHYDQRFLTFSDSTESIRFFQNI